MTKKTTGVKGTARERLRAERARQQEAERRRDRIMKIAIGAVVLVVVAAVGGLVWWQSARNAAPGVPPSGLAFGVEAADAGAGEQPGMGEGVGVGQADAPVVVEIYEDFMCPACQQFEAQTDPTIEKYVDNGDIRLVRYPLTLGHFGEPSVAAANAYACAVDAGHGEEYHDALFAAPTTWDADSLIAAAEQVDGLAGAEFTSCVEDRTFEKWVHSVEEAAAERQVSSTPTVFVAGEELGVGNRVPTTEEFSKAVDEALKEAGAQPPASDKQ